MSSISLTLLLTTIAGVAGWILARLFGPIFDEWGLQIKEKVKISKKNDYEIYSTFSQLETRIKKLHEGKHRMFNHSKPYLFDHDINIKIKSLSKKKLNLILKAWINHAKVRSYADSDVFFAGMELFLNYFKSSDIKNLFEKYKDNNQAALWNFFDLVETQNPDLLSSEILVWLKEKQNEWNKR